MYTYNIYLINFSDLKLVIQYKNVIYTYLILSWLNNLFFYKIYKSVSYQAAT